jgi:3-phenylpropionate/trans-cinnamate dioxygenase ferredoxin subunit
MALCYPAPPILSGCFYPSLKGGRFAPTGWPTLARDGGLLCSDSPAVLLRKTQTEDIPDGHMKSFEFSGTEILLVNYQGKFFAIRGKCTHMGGELAKGKLNGNIVTCPRHGAKFDVTTGECVDNPKIAFLRPKIKSEIAYKVEIEGNRISVNI